MSSSELAIPRFQAITRGVRVAVQPKFMPDGSHLDQGLFAFSYTVTIHNLGEQVVQLLERHWFVYSAEQKHEEVSGPGVVGEKPILSPGESFKYTSGVVIADPVGAMQGTYLFRVIVESGAGQEFEVEIPRFELIYPLALN